jgi:peptidyl-prolyl cis-trans isomerase B (cyclophilin B)
MHVMVVFMACLAADAAEGAPVLVADRLYCGVGRPVMVTVGRPDSVETVTLALIEADGTPVAPPREVAAERVDMAAVLPEILELRRACYLQCLHDGQPTGSALVVQPMMSRVPPRTEQAVRADGTSYTRIVGWGPPPPEDDGGETAGPAEPPAQAAAGTPPPVFSGLRIYPERDIVLRTTLGDVLLAMRPEEAPNTVWNFRHLVEGGFYDGVSFHRVVAMTRDGRPFVIQAGDPTAEGGGGPGYWLPMEPSGLPHDFGVISMARADDPDSAGSQFFICLSRAGTARLDGQYCAFGHAVEGAETIRAIADVELADVAAGRPVDPPVVVRAQLVPAPPRTPGLGRPDRPVVDEKAAARTQPDRVPR